MLRFRRFFPLLTLFPIVLMLDRFSKQWVIANLEMNESIPVIPPLLQITRSFNTGIAFGMGSEWGDLFLVLSLVVTIGMLYFYVRSSSEAVWQRVGLSLTIAGALGNVLDRLESGHVIDFFHIFIPGLVSNVSNFADHAIILGVLLIVVDDIWRNQKRTSESEQSPEETI